MNTSLIIGFTLVNELLGDASQAVQKGHQELAHQLIDMAKERLSELEEDLTAIADEPAYSSAFMQKIRKIRESIDV